MWAAIPAWTDAVIAGRPYGSVDELARARAGRGRPLDAPTTSMPHSHTTPGSASARPATGAEAAASRREQSSMTDADADVADAIAAGNVAYEERFGRVFLIRAAGRSPAEMLAELTRRLENDDDAEASEALGQLAQIALLPAEVDRHRSLAREEPRMTPCHDAHPGCRHRAAGGGGRGRAGRGIRRLRRGRSARRDHRARRDRRRRPALHRARRAASRRLHADLPHRRVLRRAGDVRPSIPSSP